MTGWTNLLYMASQSDRRGISLTLTFSQAGDPISPVGANKLQQSDVVTARSAAAGIRAARETSSSFPDGVRLDSTDGSQTGQDSYPTIWSVTSKIRWVANGVGDVTVFVATYARLARSQ
ncbi:hypothetical protein PCI56_03325 [Plesiomonas shigelloides subsp. oncorhynchi]|nr:hypothetical protein [Plesiomonas shigelloides]